MGNIFRVRKDQVNPARLHDAGQKLLYGAPSRPADDIANIQNIHNDLNNLQHEMP